MSGHFLSIKLAFFAGNNCLLFVTQCNKWWMVDRWWACERVSKWRWSLRPLKIINPACLAKKKKKEKKTNHQRSLDKILYYVSGRDDRRHRPLLGGAHSTRLPIPLHGDLPSFSLASKPCSDTPTEQQQLNSKGNLDHLLYRKISENVRREA